MEHPAVAEAGVIGKPDPIAGELVKAFVACGPATSPTDDLRRELDRRSAAARLGAAWRRRRSPSTSTCRTTRSGKIMRRLLQGPRARAARRRPVDPGECAMTRRPQQTATPRSPRPTPHTGCELLREMIRIRRFEERCVELYSATKIRGFLHLYIGEEAVAVGVMQALDAGRRGRGDLPRARARAGPRRPDGRDHGRDVRQGRGCSRGRGGSMHLFDAATGSTAATPSSAADCRWPWAWPWPTGCAAPTAVTACFFGDGAVAEGEFHECVNLAALWQLPVLFFCENNLYAMGTALDRAHSQTDLALQAPRSTAWPPGRSTAWTSRPSSRGPPAVEPVRDGGGPHFLELRTYRFRAHSMYDPEPLPRQGRGRALEAARPDRRYWRPAAQPARSPTTTLEAIEADVAAEIDARSPPPRPAAARAGRGPDPLRLHRGRQTARAATRAGVTRRCETTYREAMREAMREALRRDERVFLMGEDVGRYGGCFAVSLGLLEEFGPERIRDTPLSESAFVGAGIGAAIGGMRPIVEIMTVNFSLLALDQIVNNAATLLHMSGGQFNVPLVIRMTTGAGRQLAAQHSHSLEGWYAHIPGIEHPGAGDGRGRPRHAVAGAAGPRPGADLRARRPLQHCRRRWPRPPDGRHRPRRGPAARQRRHAGHLRRHAAPRPWRPPSELAADGHRRGGRSTCGCCGRSTTRRSCESVRRTHRAVIVDEGWRSGSLAAEISARIMEEAFYDLDAPGRAGVQRRGADALRPAPGAGGAAAGRRRSSRRRGGWSG